MIKREGEEGGASLKGMQNSFFLGFVKTANTSSFRDRFLIHSCRY